MMYTFKSCFASQIEDFIAQKNALGFGYLESSRLLRDFDRFCLTHYEQKSIMYSTSIKSSETEHFTLFHCA